MRIFARSMSACLLLLLTSAATLSAPPTLTVPENVYGVEGDWIWFTVKTDGKWVEYLGADGLTFFPSAKLKDPTEAGVLGKAGTYTITVLTGNTEAPAKAKMVVTIGKRPIPGPIVPVIPDPVNPVVPPPFSPTSDPVLVASLKTALAKDVEMFGAGEKAYCTKLGSCYLSMAKQLKEDNTVPPLTVADLISATFNTSVQLMIPRRTDALIEVRKVIDGIGKWDTKLKLTGADKDKFVALWERIGASLTDAAK